ncbi:hypothetical protein E2542_SST16475 [Spatholobus suberectus]|nr:hypothetical protein E2542_SST16475 [Spatholobus suberectus]
MFKTLLEWHIHKTWTFGPHEFIKVRLVDMQCQKRTASGCLHPHLTINNKSQHYFPTNSSIFFILNLVQSDNMWENQISIQQNQDTQHKEIKSLKHNASARLHSSA